MSMSSTPTAPSPLAAPNDVDFDSPAFSAAHALLSRLSPDDAPPPAGLAERTIAHCEAAGAASD